ncbi:MAG: AAA family ATPase, partial [archaeon]
THGRKVSFKNCVILLTSNVGTRVVKEFSTGVGFNTLAKSDNHDADIKSTLEKELKKKFAPEFINRLDDIIYFRDLGKEDIKKIVTIELSKSVKRLQGIGYESSITDSLIEHLIEVGYDPQFGARPMKRAIQRCIDDPLTDKLLDEPKVGSTLLISYDKDEDKTKIDIKKITKEKISKEVKKV